MGSSYLTLCNKVLQRLNENELTEENFQTTRGLHSTVKTSVNDAINTIHVAKSDWVFNNASHKMVLTQGVSEYCWPKDFLYVDWNSFQITHEDNFQARHLYKISRDEWYEKLRDTDTDQKYDGVAPPRWVFEAHLNGFGISPSPDKDYEVSFKYYTSPKDLEEFDDETSIPTKYDFTIVTGAMWYMNMFKGDGEASAMVERKFKDQIRDMYYQLSPRRENFYDSRIGKENMTGMYR